MRHQSVVSCDIVVDNDDDDVDDVFHLYLLKIGDHAATHQFSPALPVSRRRRALCQSPTGPFLDIITTSSPWS